MQLIAIFLVILATLINLATAETCRVSGWARCTGIRGIEICMYRPDGSMQYVYQADCANGYYCHDNHDGEPDCRVLIIPCVPYGCKVTEEMEEVHVEAIRKNVTLGVQGGGYPVSSATVTTPAEGMAAGIESSTAVAESTTSASSVPSVAVEAEE